MLIKPNVQVRNNPSLTVVKQGDTLIINGDVFDFSVIPDGATLPAKAVACEWVNGPVERVNGELQITLLVPIPEGASEAARFPQPFTVTEDGPIALPGADEVPIQAEA